MTYKGYDAVVHFDDAAGIFHGEILNTRDVVTFQAGSVRELRIAFRDSVEDYLFSSAHAAARSRINLACGNSAAKTCACRLPVSVRDTPTCGP